MKTPKEMPLQKAHLSFVYFMFICFCNHFENDTIQAIAIRNGCLKDFLIYDAYANAIK